METGKIIAAKSSFGKKRIGFAPVAAAAASGKASRKKSFPSPRPSGERAEVRGFRTDNLPKPAAGRFSEFKCKVFFNFFKGMGPSVVLINNGTLGGRF